ncbi:MAG: ABC transporter substrate-binding protein, partial [Nitrososphaerota archaeon]|nr:ABC transporter substrate-binding protein [Nitrososphaerota archaeon]
MKKRGASTASLLGVLIVGLLIGAAVTYVAAPSLVSSGPTSLCNGQTITIGALNDLSGGLSVQGQGELAAEQLAIQDVNSYLTTSGCKLTFALNNQDYRLDNPTALSELQTFHSDGIQVVVGPLNSGTAAALLSYADSNHIVMISPSSTSQALAIPND